MKRYLYCLLLILFTKPVFAEDIIHIVQNFASTDFQYKTVDGKYMITSTSKQFVTLEDTNLPCLPYIGINILIPYNSNVDSITCNVCSTFPSFPGELHNNSPRVASCNLQMSNSINLTNTISTVYPTSHIENYSIHDMGGFKFVSILFTPFKYHIFNHRTTLFNTVQFDVHTSETGNTLVSFKEHLRSSMRDILVNPNDLENWYPPISQAPLGNTEEVVDYLIITNDSLKEAFQELKEWRMTDGLNVRITTTREISMCNFAGDMAEKIKRYIHHLYEHNGLKYVLLGGDGNVVPYRQCKMEFGVNVEDRNPIDLYYAVLSEPLNWDTNNNNVYGELADNIDITPSIAIGRLPFSSRSEIANYLLKLKTYETGEKDNFLNNVLFAGCNTASGLTYFDEAPTIPISNAHWLGVSTFRECIASQNENIQLKYLFDTGSNIDDTASITDGGLQQALEAGYSLVYEYSHGETYGWQASLYGDSFYDFHDAVIQHSQNAPIIITAACKTANFRSSECLGTNFLSNPFSTTIAYWGASSTAWGDKYARSKGENVKFMESFISKFYSVPNIRFGDLINSAKNKYIGSCDRKGFRWMFLGLTGLGDPALELHSIPLLKMEYPAFYVSRDSCSIIAPTSECVISICQNDRITAQAKGILHTNVDTLRNVSRIVMKQEGYVPLILQEMRKPSLYVSLDSCSIIAPTSDSTISIYQNDSISAQAKGLLHINVDTLRSVTRIVMKQEGYVPLVLENLDFDEVFFENQNMFSDLEIKGNHFAIEGLTLEPNARLTVCTKHSIDVKRLNISKHSRFNIHRLKQ